MPRFYHQKNSSTYGSVWFSIVMFIVLIGILLVGLYFISEKNTKQEKKLLEQTIQKAIIQAYIYDGSYPESLEVLKKDFKLEYNESRFFVDYQVFGANIIPDVTVIEK